MFTNRIRITAAAFALALFAPAAAAVSAQQPPAEPQRQQQSSPAATPASPSATRYVDHRSFQSTVFTVRHRDPETLLPVLRLLTSGHNGAAVSADRTFRAITVRDFPENVASIEEAIKRLDTPEAERPGVELRMHVLLASNAATGGGAQPPADLRDVLTQLQSTLNFKSYQLLTSVVQRTKESRGRESGYLQGSGSAETNEGGEKQLFNYTFSADSLALAAGAPTTVQLGNFNFTIVNFATSPNSTARIHSDVSLREGERVVVGTAGMRDKALILVLTARTIK